MSPTLCASDRRPDDGRLFFEASADFDTLTGFVGRRSFFDQIDTDLKAHGCADRSSSLILIDLDRFKAVNDGYGPSFGDALLTLVADRIRTAVDQPALLGRISGDGFGVYMSGQDRTLRTAEKLLANILQPFLCERRTIFVTASIGSAVASNQYVDAGILMHRAGLALHQAQAEGGSKHHHFEPKMEAIAKNSQGLEQDLRTALRSLAAEPRTAQFEIHYQPQADLERGQLTGFEALVRWRHPVRGMVSPVEFIPIAEATGLIVELGQWVLAEACRQAQSWPAPAGGRPIRLSVNVSPRQLVDADAIVDAVKQSLFKSGLQPHRLEIEITESALMQRTGQALQSLKKLGISLALDDFGTGFSSLSQLSRHPFDRLKIDRSFLVGSDGNDTDESQADFKVEPSWMVRAIAALGAGLGMDTIVEGVETEEQVALVRSAGCTEMQGYFLSRPVQSSDVSGVINGWSAALARPAPQAESSGPSPAIRSLPPSSFCKARMCAFWTGQDRQSESSP